MDGVDSNIFHYFKSLILRGLIELRKNIDYFVKIIEIMAKGIFNKNYKINFFENKLNYKII